MRLLLLILVFLQINSVYANESKFRLKTHPLSLPIVGLNAEVEIFLGNKFSISPAFYIVDFGPEDEKIEGVDVGANANYYFSSSHKDSFFISPFLHYFNLTKDHTPRTTDDNENSVLEPQKIVLVGSSLGYQVMWSKNFSTAFEIGVYRIAKSGSLVGQMLVPITPTLTIGYDFGH